jgi:DHA1 family bicyclomycin/chloramphenicol resistance-like MFS transporter
MSQMPIIRFLDRSTPPHLFTLILLAGLSTLSLNVFLPSLPGMTAYFETDYHLMQLAVTLYLGMNAALQVLIGPISDRYGRRPVLLWCLVIFIFATFGCLLAPNVGVFLAFRMLQAVVGAGMVLSRAVVRDMVSTDKAASMMAYVTMGMALVPMFAPALGGVLDAAFGWKANFWLLVLLGVFVLWVVWRDLGETGTRREGKLIDQIREYPELLTSPRFWGYVSAASFSSGAFFAYLGGAPFVGKEIFHLSSAELGLLFGTTGWGYLIGNWIAARMSVRFGINMMILVGGCISAFGLLVSILLHLVGLGGAFVFFGLMVPLGMGNGMVMPNASAGMVSVRPGLAGSAAGLGGAMMLAVGAVMSGFAGVVLGPGSGPTPLLLLMQASTVPCVIAIVLVIRRERRLRIPPL